MAVLGMRGSGNFAKADERPKHYRQMIMLLFPNGDAPLTAILSMLKSRAVDDPEFRWFEKGLPVQRGRIVGASLTVEPADDANINAGGDRPDTVWLTVQPDDGTKYDTTWLKVGHVLMVESTGELLLVTVKTSGTNAYIKCERDIGQMWAASGGGQAIDGQADGTGDYISIVGTGFQEGAAIGNSIAFAPLSHFNYTQIFRDPLSLTRTARKTKLRWDRRGAWIEARREALQQHAIQMEKAFIWGERVEMTSLDITGDAPFNTGIGSGTPLRTTRGIVNWLPTILTGTTAGVHWDIGNSSGYGGVFTENAFEAWCEEIFRYGGNEKLLLAGSTFINVLNQMAKNKMTITAVPTDQTYGMDLTRVITPFGNLLLKQHPLMSHHPTWRKDAICVDTDKLVYRYIDDTAFLVNRQSPGDDASKDEYLTEAGLEMHFSGATSDSGVGGALGTGTAPAAHGRLKGVATYGG